MPPVVLQNVVVQRYKVGATTLSIMPFRIKTFSIMTLSMTIFNITMNETLNSA
jgi:hypothetical protein